MTIDATIGPSDRARFDCLSLMRDSGLTRASAAREIGVSGATLSLWLSSKYDGDNDRIGRLVARWLETRREALGFDLADAGLDIHCNLSVSEDIEATLAHAQSAGDVVLITGPSGAGKSWACRRYCETRASAYWMSMTRARRTMTSLLDQVCRTVGAHPARQYAADCEAAAIERLTDRRALLVVDEAHYLPPQLLDELRCVRDQSGCGLAYVGDPAIERRLWRCPQILGRIACRLPLTAPSELDVRTLLSVVLGRPAQTGEVRAALVAARSPGGLHALRRTLERAWMAARIAKRDAIAVEDLDAAAEQVFDMPAKVPA